MGKVTSNNGLSMDDSMDCEWMYFSTISSIHGPDFGVSLYCPIHINIEYESISTDKSIGKHRKQKGKFHITDHLIENVMMNGDIFHDLVWVRAPNIS